MHALVCAPCACARVCVCVRMCLHTCVRAHACVRVGIGAELGWDGRGAELQIKMFGMGGMVVEW